MVDALEIGYSIKDRRMKLGMTQAQVAEAAGVSKRCLWSMELGQNSGVQLDKLTSVFRVLGLELEIRDSGKRDLDEAEHRHESKPIARVTDEQADAIDALSILTGGSR